MVSEEVPEVTGAAATRPMSFFCDLLYVKEKVSASKCVQPSPEKASAIVSAEDVAAAEAEVSAADGDLQPLAE